MMTAARLRGYTGPSGLLALFRDLGYPVAPVEVDAEEWRRGGVSIPWNGNARLQLAARMRRFDLFTLCGTVSRESIAEFLRSYKSYNQTIKSVVGYQQLESNIISVFDLSRDGVLRLFELSPSAPGAHALDRLNLLQCGDESALPRIFDRALDRESITRRFFRRFKSATAEVGDALAAAFPAEKREAVDAQALLVLSRLLFISFIQEKGWLAGERRFLVDRLEHEMSRGREFYSGVLVPLFFGCLNTPAPERDFAASRLGRVPYLNGGLFEPSLFERRHPSIHLSNSLVQPIVEEVFEKFDFRADEGDGYGTHVDPEMLGKVFESLMAGGERAASGSYYTPREIVDTLTGDALDEWLARPAGAGPAAKLARLAEITVLDPACGSGAFLLSALYAIERRWRSLAAEAGVEVPHDLRRRIVARSLYGVDLKPEAVRLCELRLWLAIVAQTAGPAEEVEPLPNLDRNIFQGNSLLGPADFLGEARRDIYGDWVQALRAQRDLLERYRTASHAQRPALARVIRSNDQRLAYELLSKSAEGIEEELRLETAPRRDLFGRAISPDVERCRELHARIAATRKMVERVEEGSLDFFSLDVHFAPVMAAGGFDVVIGNPPWVRNARIEGGLKRAVSERYPLFRRGDGAGFHQPDLSVAFLERATQVTAPDGVVAMLVPAKIANASYAGPLRRALASRHTIVTLRDWSDDPRTRRWFEADTFPLGIVLALGKALAPRTIEVTAAGEEFRIGQEDLAGGSCSEWSLVPPAAGAILARIRAAHRSLEQVVGRRPFMGVKTGDNGGFFFEPKSVGRQWVTTAEGQRIPLANVCRCVRGRDLRRWAHQDAEWMLWPPPRGWSRTPEWLRKYAEGRGVEADGLRLSFVRPEHVGVKVAWKDLSRGVAAAVLPASERLGEVEVPLVPNQTLYCLDAVSLDEAHAVAAVLNSTVAGALLLAVAERAKDRHYRYFGRTIGAMPFPASGTEEGRLARFARKAALGMGVAEDLDLLVARLYGIGTSELAILREFVEGRLGARPASD